MSISLADALVAIKVHARQMEAYQVISDAIADVGKIDQLRDEAEAALAAKKDEIGSAQGTLAQVLGQIQAANTEVVKAAQRAQDAEASANGEANKIISDARDAADAIIQAANADAAKIAASTKDAESYLSGILAKIEAAGKELAETSLAHSDLLQKIADAKDVIAKMMGA